jgi:general secretion pathway protein L
MEDGLMWKRRILGVDVGSTAIKVAQAEETSFGRRTLCRVAICDDLKSFEDLLDAKAWWKPGDWVHLGFPSDQVVVRGLKLPFQAEAKIQQTLPFELEGDIPFPVEDIVAHYLVREKDNEGTGLLALASTVQAVGGWLDRFRPLGLDPVILEPEVSALSHLVPGGAPGAPATFGILDMGATKTNFVLIHDNRIQTVRCLRQGLGTSKNLPLPADMVREIDRTFKTLRSGGEDPWLEALFLGGGGSEIPGATGWLEARWDVPVRLLSPLDAAPCVISENEDVHSVRLSTAIGLALSGQKGNACNLRSGPFVFKPGLSMFKGRALVAGILVVLAVVLGLGDLYAHLLTKQSTLRALKEETNSLFRKAFPEVTQIVDPALQMQRMLEEQKARELSLLGQDPRGSSVEILREISLRVQPSSNLRLTEFDLSEDAITLRGEADEPETIDKAKARWQESPLLEDVQVKSTKKNPKTKLWEFQCTARRKYS